MCGLELMCKDGSICVEAGGRKEKNKCEVSKGHVVIICRKLDFLKRAVIASLVPYALLTMYL